MTDPPTPGARSATPTTGRSSPTTTAGSRMGAPRGPGVERSPNLRAHERPSTSCRGWPTCETGSRHPGRGDHHRTAARGVSRPAVRPAPSTAQAAAVPGRHAGPGRHRTRRRSCSIPTPSTRPARRPSTGSSRRPTARSSPCRCRQGGSEAGDVHVYDAGTGRRWTRSCRGSTAARPAGTWRGPPTARASSTPAIRGPGAAARDLDFYQQVYYHALGTPAVSRPV